MIDIFYSSPTITCGECTLISNVLYTSRRMLKLWESSNLTASKILQFLHRLVFSSGFELMFWRGTLIDFGGLHVLGWTNFTQLSSVLKFTQNRTHIQCIHTQLTLCVQGLTILMRMPYGHEYISPQNSHYDRYMVPSWVSTCPSRPSTYTLHSIPQRQISQKKIPEISNKYWESLNNATIP